MSNVMTQHLPAAAFASTAAWHAVNAPALTSAYGATAVSVRIDGTFGVTDATAVKRTTHLVTSRASSPPV